MNIFTEVITSNFEDALIDELNQLAPSKKFTKGESIISYAQEMKFMPLLISGSIKIFRQNEDGDELVLYYLEEGDACSMSMTCCMGNRISEIRAEVESDCELILIPIHYMASWIEKYHSWRTYVFNSYQNRFDELLSSIDNLAFNDMHGRLVNYLREKVIASKTDKIHVTHQVIANEMNTSRVVVSRLLKKLESEKIISQSRNEIEVLEF